MSLQIWLPLNGNLNNYELSSVNVAGSPTVNSSGKIGQCYACNSSNYFYYTNSITAYDYSFSFWMKIPSSMASVGAWNIMFYFHAKNTNNDETVRGCYIEWASYNNIKIYDEANHQNIWMAPGNQFNYDIWSHYTITQTGTDSGCTIKVYTDGILRGTYNNEHRLVLSPGDIVFGSGINPSYGPLYVNDFRMYDHCLSYSEVKEISRALVVHYPLNDEYLEPTVNYTVQPSTYSTSSSPYWDTSLNGSVVYAPSGWADGYNGGVSDPGQGYHAHWVWQDNKLVILFPNKNSVIGQSGRWLGISYGNNSFTDTSLIPAGTKYTISYEQMTDHVGSVTTCGIYYRLSSSSSSWNFWDGCNECGRNTKAGVWERFSVTYTRHSYFDGAYTGGSLYIYGMYGTEADIYVRNIQIEVKDHATPYVNGTRSESTVYDCSGYGNNGTATNKIQILKDGSLRYDKSIYFTNANQHVSVPASFCPSFANSYTFAYYGKISSISGRMAWGFSNGNRLNVYPSTYFCWNTGDGGSNPFKDSNGAGVSYSAYSDNKWHHYAVTGDGTTTKLYIDGVYKGSATYYRALTGTQIYLSGWDTSTDYKWLGSLSDFRIYATALSAEDIASLYKTFTSVDKEHRLHCYEIIEE